MSEDSPQSLDKLLEDWSASREADGQQVRELSIRILAAVRQQTDDLLDASAGDDSPFVDRPVPARRYGERRHLAIIGGMWILGGGALLLLVLAASVLYLNLEGAPSNSPLRKPSVVRSSGGELNSNDHPAAARVGAAVLAAKRRLLSEARDLFDNQLAWIADGEDEVLIEVFDSVPPTSDEFLLVRIVVAERASPESPWSTVWQTDVISRNKAVVEVASKELSLALWTYQLPDGEIAVDMELQLERQTPIQVSSHAVLHAGQPRYVDCSTDNGIERCVFQTAMPLSSSKT
jgi:hypothetical protein